MAENVARKLLWPSADENVLLRTAVLFVGQGSANVVLAKQGDGFETMLVDINLDSTGGIDVPVMVKDLLDSQHLGVFVNTHPHNDHLCGLKELSDLVDVDEVWHSGHVPGKKDRAAYDELQDLIKKVKKAGGSEVELDGSRHPVEVGEAECYTLAPAEHVKDEIDDEDEDERRKRIHEYCAVLRLGKGDNWIMLPGDADRDAWEQHITEYHKERLPSFALVAAHHGSRSFFKKSEDDNDPYLDALDAIDPEYVVMSAPTREKSRHKHPHPDAVSLYEDKVGADNVLHTGADGYSFIVDIYTDGTYAIKDDEGLLFKAYPYSPDSGDDGQKQSSAQRTSRPAILGGDGRSA